MRPAVVVDVGNTRIKWGRCTAAGLADTCSLPPDDPAAWQQQLERWPIDPRQPWAVASVQPARSAAVVQWLRERGTPVRQITHAAELPLTVAVEKPDHVGIDRLFDAVAANSRRRDGVPAAIVDAGSAVTVDWLDASGTFRGGAILPGLGLMAKSLHEHTALLPLVEVPRRPPPLPGTATIPAMEAGIFWAVAGGIKLICEQYAASAGVRPDIFLTGGDGPALFDALGPGVQLWSAMTLEGIRLAAEALP